MVWTRVANEVRSGIGSARSRTAVLVVLDVIKSAIGGFLPPVAPGGDQIFERQGYGVLGRGVKYPLCRESWSIGRVWCAFRVHGRYTGDMSEKFHIFIMQIPTLW